MKPFAPDDPRHGRYAGYVQHMKNHEPACDPCMTAGRRTRKRYQLHGGQVVTIGEPAWRIVHETPRTQLAVATGISTSVLRRIDLRGPEARVYGKTRATILHADPAAFMTPLGAARRLQALAYLGWSARYISQQTGVWPDNLIQIRLGQRSSCVKRDVARKIHEIYQQLHMTPAPVSRHSTAQRNKAREMGWLPPLAWDNIDDPNEDPSGNVRTIARHGPGAPAIEWTRDDLLEWLAAGLGVSDVVRRMGTTRRNLQRWCERYGNHDLYRALILAEQPWRTDLGA